jgi:hypothetical protein
MNSWIGASPSGDAGPPSFFQEDFSNILQEQGLNEFVNLLGIADHSQFNAFHYHEDDGTCSSTIDSQQSLARVEAAGSRLECAEDCGAASNATSDTDYLVPSPYTEAETPKQSRGTSPDPLDHSVSQNMVTMLSKRRRTTHLEETGVTNLSEDAPVAGTLLGSMFLIFSFEFTVFHMYVFAYI